MSSFLLDANGDLDLTNNEVTLTTGIDAIRQHLENRFRLFLGEWFLDTSLGVPWFRDVLIKAPTFAVVKEVLKKTILETAGVLVLTNFVFDFDPSLREVSLTFSALTQEGPIDFTQVVEIPQT